MSDNGDDDRPIMPRNLSTVKSEEAIRLVTQFRVWFTRPEFQHDLADAASRTKEFLTDNNCTSSAFGAIGEPEPWAKIENVPVSELQPTEDEVRLDLRLSALRIRTFAEGACRFIGIMEELKALPKNAYTYCDPSTNLAEWFQHEGLMRTYLRTKASGLDPDKADSVKLSDLLPLYMYSEKAQQGALRGKLVQMVSVGLWDADPPKSTTNPTKEWKITVGPLAVTFHRDVFWPVVQHFKLLLRGGSGSPTQVA